MVRKEEGEEEPKVEGEGEPEPKTEEEEKELHAVAEALTPMVLEKIKNDKPLRKDIFGGSDTGEKAEILERKTAAAEYLKKLALGQNTKDLSAGVSGSGSELVPTYVSDQIISVAQNYGLIRKYARKWPMQGINVNIPTMTTLTAYRLATDVAAITASQPTTGALELRAKTVGVIIPISKVLLQNSTADLIDAITQLAGKAIAKLEDQWGLLGLGVGEGVFQTTGVPVHTLGSGDTDYADVIAEDLLSALDLLDENFYGENLRWAMSLSILNVFRKLRSVVGSDKQGFLFEGFGGSIPATMWDIPYDISAVMPKNADVSQAGKKFIGLVNYDNLIHGDAMEYTMEMSDQATVTDTDGTTLINLFQQNMVALKVYGLIDIALSNPTKAHSVIATAAS
jgi:HK97 family phage major capsid protein